MADPDLPGVVLNQEYRVKLGKSFTFPKENAFHTIKYDFKPLSVDLSQPGKLRVGEGDEVNMSLPVVQAESADDVVQFRGPKRPCTRECMLIINMDTGEAILEKIGSSVNLKSLRDGRTKAPRDRSISPAPPFLSKNTAAAKMGHSGKSTAHDRKMHKLHPKSRNKTSKVATEQGGSSTSGVTSLTVPGASVKPLQGNTNSPKVKKSQKKQPKNSNAFDVQVGPSLTAPPPKLSTFPPELNESNPVSQPVSLPVEPAQTRQRLEDSSGSSSGSSSSSSAGSSDSESETESHAHHVTPGGFAAGGTGMTTAAPETQSIQPPQPVRASMPVLGSGGISIPPFPIQSAPAGDSSSSSASDSESSSDSSSSGSSSDSSDSEMKKFNADRAPVVSAPQQVTRSYSTLEDELSCSSDSD